MSLKDDARVLNRILILEKAAAETYGRILNHGAGHMRLWPLHEIAERHRQAVGRVAQQIEALGEECALATSTPLWTGVTRDTQVKINHDRTLLKGLRQRELDELASCEQALRRGSDYGPTRSLLSGELMPMLALHARELDAMLG